MKPPKAAELVEMPDPDLNPMGETGIGTIFQYYLSDPGATDKLLVPFDQPDGQMPDSYIALDNIYRSSHGDQFCWEGSFSQFALKRMPDLDTGGFRYVRDSEPFVTREAPQTKWGVPGAGTKFGGFEMPLYKAFGQKLFKPWRYRSVEEYERDVQACRVAFDHDAKVDAEAAAWRAEQAGRRQKAMRSPAEREQDMAAAIAKGIATALPAALEAIGIIPPPPKKKKGDDGDK